MPLPPQPPLPIPGMQASALDIIKGAMRAVTMLSAGENPTANETQDYLAILNEMLDSWNAERLMIPVIQRLGPFTLVAGQQAYTVGSGGYINIPRPPRIELITIIYLNNPATPAEIGLDTLDAQGWAAIPVKFLGGPLPQKVWNDLGYPLMTLNYWPYPTVQVQTVFYAWMSLNFFPNQSQVLSFPPAYLEALRWNLAIRLDNAEISPQVMQMAAESKARIKSFNAPILLLTPDTELLDPRGGSYNWLSDTPVIRGRNF